MRSGRILFLIIFLTVVSLLAAQDKTLTFKLTDSTFKPGSYLRTYSIIYKLGSCELHEYSFPFLDSLSDFLKKHENLRLQINRHDYKPDPNSSMHAAGCRARSVNDYLVNKGISKERLAYKGYNGTEPLVTQKQLDKAGTQEEKTGLMISNLRVEFVISSIK